MSRVPVFVEIDYHQDSVQACVLDSSGKRLSNRSVGNDAAVVAEARIRAAVADDPIVERLLAQDGVGVITAVTMRPEIGRFDRFTTGKQLARFCGVTPRNASNGARQTDAGLVPAGNPELRMVLIKLAQRSGW